MLRLVCLLAFGLLFLGVLSGILGTAALLVQQLVNLAGLTLLGLALYALLGNRDPPENPPDRAMKNPPECFSGG